MSLKPMAILALGVLVSGCVAPVEDQTSTPYSGTYASPGGAYGGGVYSGPAYGPYPGSYAPSVNPYIGGGYVGPAYAVPYGVQPYYGGRDRRGWERDGDRGRDHEGSGRQWQDNGGDRWSQNRQPAGPPVRLPPPVAAPPRVAAPPASAQVQRNERSLEQLGFRPNR